tara:strand:+ start:1131 stop:1277 length:147 start_codon:yes stop_codon:yes gene_type:complete
MTKTRNGLKGGMFITQGDQEQQQPQGFSNMHKLKEYATLKHITVFSQK